MNKQIGRNDPCPCGSGKKYKYCCLGKSDNPKYAGIEQFAQFYKEMRKEARFKECIYPDHTSCSEKIIGAHSIQNNRILSKIADNGKVYMPAMKLELSLSLQKEYGRKEASVFTGFCGYHDKTVFQPIEDRAFQGTEEQVFLYTYRAFALEYHRKQEAVRMGQRLFSEKPSLIGAPGYMIKGQTGFSMAVNDYMEEKKLFDEALLSHNYGVLRSFVWSFNGFSNFAATGAEAPTMDFDSHQIQNLLDPDITARHIYTVVFPEGEKTYAIIAWFLKYDKLFEQIGNKLNNLTEDERRNYINNTLPLITENIAIRPSSWDAISEQSKEEFAMIFGGMADLFEMTGTKFDRFEKPSFDLFSL